MTLRAVSSLSRVSLLALAACALAACANGGSAKSEPAEGAHGAQAAEKPAAERPAPAAADYAAANELGGVPVLEYHRFGPKEERWTRTAANFRKDLEFLRANGYALVTMADVAARKIDLPAGKKPVVLTFDDATEGQFRYLTDSKGKARAGADGKPLIDPDCAVGVLDAFYAKHPDFGRAATFYVLPSGFEQDAYIAEKFKYLVATGRELGNHTWAHDELRALSAAQVEKSLGKLQAFVGDQLGEPYPITTLALPYGIGPRDAAALAKVVSGGTGKSSYRHAALMLVGANPSYSPYDVRYKPTAVPRIQAIDSEFATWFNRKAGSVSKAREPWVPYVSDGDAAKVSFPAALAPKLNAKALAGGQAANPVAAPGSGKPAAN